jgi:arylsulfatase A-like enzyme
VKLARREFLSGAAAAATAAAAAAQNRPARPNVLFILADDLGYGDLGCYGQQKIQTPILDRLASEGVRFTQAYSGSTVCAPSRCCLMTGKHTGHATVRGNVKPELGLAAGEVTVASMLKSAGYRTALFGKWGLGGFDMNSHPNDKGFDQFFGYLNQQHAHNSYPEYLWDNRSESAQVPNWFFRRKVFSNDLFTQKALDFVGEGSAKPFFLYLTYTIPHANNELTQVQKNGIESPDLGIYANRDWPDSEKSFASAVTRMDDHVGRVLAKLDEKGLAENTLVFFTSDNGPHKEGGHDPNFFLSSGAVRGTKRDLYEGGIRVPSMVRWKGKTTPGVTSDMPWAFWDFLPTAAEAAGVRAPAGGDGRSILPALLGRSLPPVDHFYWEFYEGGFQQAVRQGDWKLVRQAPRFRSELFNLREDLREEHDVAAAHGEVVARLEKLIRAEHTEHPKFPSKG